jgi:murein DD-endopeptidase MepM/ murein hydrolase activator NlpD
MARSSIAGGLYMVKKIPFFLLIIINVFVANIAFAYSEDIEAIGQEIGGGGGRLDWPVPTSPAVMTSAFGYRVHPITGNVRHHGGVDLAGDFGDLIYAAGDGVVEDASIGYNGGYGNLVIIDHGNGLKTYYGHNSNVDVYPGNRYMQGRLSLPWGQRELLLARTVTLEQS